MRLPAASLIFIAACTSSACDTDWGADAEKIIEELPREELIGCYRAGPKLPSLEVTNDSIFADGSVLHPSYEYGHAGRNGVPVVRFQSNGAELEPQPDGSYSFVQQSSGGDTNYTIERHNAFVITIVSTDALQHKFVRGSCS